MSQKFTIKDLEQLKGAGLIRDYKTVEVVNNPKKPKFGNVKTELDGIIFDSAKEARRYVELRYLMNAGEITDLKLQVEYKLSVCKYVCDFQYQKNGETIVEDVKSRHTRKLPVYRMKKKMMKAELGIDIKEV
jgi:ribosomal protein S8